VGTAVALSNSLGLNRDCSAWEISPGEKALRSRIWSIVVLMDRWCVLQGLIRLISDTDPVTGQVLLTVHHC
jgi:hypothetical protein